MFHRILKTLAVALIVIALAPAAAIATDTDTITPTVEIGPTIEKRVADGIVWIDTYMPTADTDGLRVNLRAPLRNGGRHFFQRCDFVYQGPGRYSCGFRRSDVAGHRGSWLAILRIKGERIASKTFRVRSATR